MVHRLLCAAALSAASTVVAAPPALPPTPKKPVADVYHGVSVTDDYRWLEDGNDPAVRKWSDAQNKRTHAILDAQPQRSPIAKRLRALYAGKSVSYYDLQLRGGTLFAIKSQPPKQQPFLVALKSTEETRSERIVLDPNYLDASGDTTIDFYAPSMDGTRVAVCLSKNGSEDGSVHVYDTRSGKALEDIVPGVNYPTAGGSVAWRGDGAGFFYTRYPKGEERAPEDLHFYQEVFFHKLGRPLSEDAYVLGGDFPRIAETDLETSDDGRFVLATVSNGDGGEYAHYVLQPSGWWAQVTTFADKITSAAFGPNDTLYLLSHQGAPRGKVLRVPLIEPKLSEAVLVIPQSDAVVRQVIPAADHLYVVDVIGGPSRIRVCDPAGKQTAIVPIPPVSAVGGALRVGDALVYNVSSFTLPGAWYRYDPASGKSTRTALFRTSPADFADAEVVRATAVSKDGTKVPLSILMRKGTVLDGKNPLLLTGYGGYGIVESPGFNAGLRLWLDAGGIYASGNIRGGGEFGEDWHLQGNLTKKQNVFDDFTGCAQYLVKAGYTSADKLAIQGGSNGGLLMGAVLTQHPGLFKAVVSQVGDYDMLREELTDNGQFNVTEFGSVKDPEQFKALYAYSPYHHVKDGTQYPAVLFTAGDNDGRVAPWNSRKMTARLQASGTKRPVLLRTSAKSGHGIGDSLDESIAEDADIYAFLFWQLGMTLPPAKK
ncbi:MAG TPA: prolyl oligopeptidase family serine peptidase [Armatimonadota bacterium]|jgi:prolyl oligopeptidase